MTKEQEALLLTVARVLRDNLRDQRPGSETWSDIAALDEALKPFDDNVVGMVSAGRGP